MDFEKELFAHRIADALISELYDLNFEDVTKQTATQAAAILKEIQTTIKNDSLSDFDVIEEIICIFEKHRLDAGNRHDF
ncbi:MAG: hypothetical protein ACI4DP_00925 [Candidatus Ornithomonoglobus sp.]